APYINIRGARYAAQFLQPLVGVVQPELGQIATSFLQELPQNPAKPLYRGKLAVLIDDRAVSQAEHSCLFFEAAAGVTFIGSPTHGTNGDITTMRLPG